MLFKKFSLSSNLLYNQKKFIESVVEMLHSTTSWSNFNM